MKKKAKILTWILVGFSILVGIAIYFDTLVIPAIVVGATVSVIVGFIVMMQVYNYDDEDWGWDYKPALYWSCIAVIAAVILLGDFIAAECDVINKKYLLTMVAELCPFIVPLLGVFLGNIGRVLRGKSAVWY